MVTLKQLFQTFGHDPKWGRLATQSAQPMVSVFMRKLGNTDIETLTDFDIELQLAMSEQPEDRKVKARSCMHYMLLWAKERGRNVPQIAHPLEVRDEPDEHHQEPEPKPKPKQVAKPKPKLRLVAQPKPKPKQVAKPKPKQVEKSRKKQDTNTRKGRTGTIYHDSGSNGYTPGGRRVFKDCWRAEITISGQRYRHRSKERDDCVAWLRAVRHGRIKPTENKADWWRMEQRKDEAVRIDEIIVSQAEESVMLYDYHQTHDISTIFDYLEKRLLPHMAYYCAHTLGFGKDRTLTASRQAAALLLTRIVAGRPVLNFTASCKRMLRIHKQRGDFFYYENAPEAVKLMVNRIDMSALADLYKVTKDRRI